MPRLTNTELYAALWEVWQLRHVELAQAARDGDKKRVQELEAECYRLGKWLNWLRAA